MNISYNWKWKFIALLCASMLLVNQSAAQESERPTRQVNQPTLQVPLYKSKLIYLRAPATRISVGNPDVADILILRSTQLYVLGKDCNR